MFKGRDLEKEKRHQLHLTQHKKFAITHPNAFGTSQTRKTLYATWWRLSDKTNL
jgi:hypothetical protein